MASKNSARNSARIVSESGITLEYGPTFDSRVTSAALGNWGVVTVNCRDELAALELAGEAEAWGDFVAVPDGSSFQVSAL